MCWGCSGTRAARGRRGEGVHAWEKAAFAAAPVKVKAMATGILVVMLALRLVLGALGWVMYPVLTVVR